MNCDPHMYTQWQSVRLGTWLGFSRHCRICGHYEQMERQLDPDLPTPPALHSEHGPSQRDW